MDHALEIPQRLSPSQCPAFILAGGRSSRFGSDKARVQVGDGPLLLTLRRKLIEQGHTVEIVADRADRYADLGVNCLIDWQPDHGPLAGVATALKHREQQSGWLLLLSCDLIDWRGAWFKKLSDPICDLPTTTNNAAFLGQATDAVAFQRCQAASELQAEPFPSLLHSRLWPQAVALLGSRKRSLQSLFAEARTVVIDTQENPQAWTFNTVEQLQALLA